MTSGTRTLLKTLWLPFESIKTIYEGTSEVRLYKNDITGVQQIGKRVSAIGAEDRATVFREPTILQSISHDNIVPVHDVAIVDSPASDKLLTVIEMIIPYYDKGSVYDALDRGERFSIGKAVRLTRDGLNGLSELHERQHLLHRDIKSGNVFIDGRGRLRVGDLGLAVPMRADGTADAFPATQIYTAPETFVSRTVSRQTDIYGFGLVLFELLNGPLPYAKYTRTGISTRLAQGKRPPTDSDLLRGPHIPSRLRTILNKALAIGPADRYGTAREMMDALDGAPFIDWGPSTKTDDVVEWQGRAADGRGDLYRISARRIRNAGWMLSAQKFRNRWQRFGVKDQDVDALIGPASTAFFDQVVKHATKT